MSYSFQVIGSVIDSRPDKSDRPDIALAISFNGTEISPNVAPAQFQDITTAAAQQGYGLSAIGSGPVDTPDGTETRVYGRAYKIGG